MSMLLNKFGDKDITRISLDEEEDSVVTPSQGAQMPLQPSASPSMNIDLSMQPDVPPVDPDEEPVVIIETDGTETPEPQTVVRRQLPRHFWRWVVGILFALAVLAFVGHRAYVYLRAHYFVTISVSVSPKENIAKLQLPITHHRSKVDMTTDSVDGIVMNFYELRHLAAHLTFTEPEPDDENVMLYTRCSDVTSFNPREARYIGSLVVDGKEYSDDQSRIGYCGMVDGQMVIGVARTEEVKDYCLDHHGSFFRQFILVSNREIPSQFYLFGKVERRALARTQDPQTLEESLYVVETTAPQTMADFAQALQKWGFIDAIYITGGNDYCYYRSTRGNIHPMGDPEAQRTDKHKKGVLPWLVFEKI